MNHPNISTIYSIEDSDSEVFIAMEFIDGIELKDKIKSGSIPTDEAINIAIQIAEGLEAAHKKGIVHRDIKSQNIMITKDGKVKIMDFGLAKIRGGSQVTKIGTTVGTTANMSPEQARGEEVDQRTDIWSLGVVLYEMLTRQIPFKGDYDQAIVYSILNEEPKPAFSINKDVSGNLEEIIKKLLEKDINQRYQEMEAVIKDIIDYRNPVGVKLQEKDKDVKSIAVLPFADISQEQDNKYFSDGLTEEIINRLSKLKKVKVISRTSVMNYNRSGKTMKQIASELDIRYIIEGSVRKDVSKLRITTQLIDANQDACLWADKYNGTMNDIFDIQENVAVKIVKAFKMRLSPAEKRNLKQHGTLKTEAYHLYLKGRFSMNKRNRDGLEIAIKYFEQAIEIDSHYALAWAGIADSYNLLGEYGTLTRREIYPKAMEAVKKALEFDNKLAEAHTSLASLLMLDEWDWKNAQNEFQTAIKLNPNYVTAHHWYAEWLLFNGRTDEALKEISIAVELEPLSAAVLKDKGMMLYYSRKYDEAIDFAKKTLEMDPEFNSVHRLLSLIYQEKDLINEAITENQIWNDLTHNDLEASIALARCLALAGKEDEALQKIKSIDLEDLKNENLLRSIALVYLVLNKNDLALECLENGFEKKAVSLCLLKIDPKLDPIRSDPRFKSLIERVGLMK